MKIMIKTRITPKMRALSFFMAFLMFSLTFIQVLDGLDFGLIVHAVVKGPNIQSNTTETGISSWKNMTSPSDSKFKYTGNILAQTANVYDYLSDEEITNGWNTNMTQSVVSGYSDPYTQFNNWISNETVTSAASNNIRIVFQVKGANPSVGSGDDIYLHMWSSTNSSLHTTYPGIKMTYTGQTYGKECFECIFSTTDIRYVGFLPNCFEFSKRYDDGHYSTYGTVTNGSGSSAPKAKFENQTVAAGNGYYFSFDNGDRQIYLNAPAPDDITINKYVSPL